MVRLADFDVSHQAAPCARVQDVHHSSHQVIHTDTTLLLCLGQAPLRGGTQAAELCLKIGKTGNGDKGQGAGDVRDGEPG